MARYKMTINTDTYKCGRCSKKNWEPGTQNDYMIAINGITRTLYNMREVMWQLELFHGNSFVMSEYSDDNQTAREDVPRYRTRMVPILGQWIVSWRSKHQIH